LVPDKYKFNEESQDRQFVGRMVQVIQGDEHVTQIIFITMRPVEQV
jgi:hypothetical protein